MDEIGARAVFKAARKKGDADDTVLKKTWASFDEPEGEPDWSIVTGYLWDSLDRVNNRWLEGDGDLIENWFDDDKVKSYFSDVSEVLKYATTSIEVDKTIGDNIIHKVRWYKYESPLQDRLRIPLLTPKCLDALAAYINKRAKAYEEVSDI